MDLLQGLNGPQKEAVLHTEGPLLILAGAGSGKTRVLTHRIAFLIEECGIRPWNILAITFTNKAAKEMRERVDRLVAYGSDQIWVSTFHSACVRILRRFADRLGYTRGFTIYDTDDQKTLIRDVCRQMDIDTKKTKERFFLSEISSAKNAMITPDDMAREAGGDLYRQRTAQVYRQYSQALQENNAMDFDDLLLKTVELLETQPDVLELYQEQFQYIHVDEYQDTNHVQFRMAALLSGKYKNICVVGDDDQSIYRFRGANIRNILDFEASFPDAQVIKLEQNYRSTKLILEAANDVIANNTRRKAKKLWTDNEQGAAVRYRCFDRDVEEAGYICRTIRKMVPKEASFGDFAVLYRTNAQSRVLEEQFVAQSIPYRLFGGVNFYGRKEVKDVLAYLRTAVNDRDDIAVKRIINVPRRGIGATTIAKLEEAARQRQMALYDMIGGAYMLPEVSRASAKLEKFAALIEHLKIRAQTDLPSELIREVLLSTGYEAMLREEEDWEDRLDNIQELINKAADYEKGADEKGQQATLSGFLEEVSLVADIDAMDDEADCVILMTLHSAKGLEFPHVFMAGMEEGLFPGYLSISSGDPDDMEEERRLCYVGITRACRTLTLTGAKRRFVRGEFLYQRPSRFVEELSHRLDVGEKQQAKWEDGESSVSRDAKKYMESMTDGYKKPEYVQAREAFRAKPFAVKGSQLMQDFAVDGKKGVPYKEGDRVSHVKFGEGTVKKIVSGGRDYEVTVDFDRAGTRKMFAAFARLKKLS